jgi:colanic acid/amylovoran biosynthesis glycosyltransferase
VKPKLGFVCGLFPYAFREQYFEAEVSSLVSYFDVESFETRATSKIDRYENVPGKHVYLGVLNVRVLTLAVREFALHPGTVARVLARIAFSPCSFKGRVVNLLLFPKALALAQTARADAIEHFHVNWLTSSATVVYVASELTGIPFSITAHQHDIFADNLLALKVRASEFVRVISERNCRFLQARLPEDLRAKCFVGHLGVRLPERAATPEPRDGPVRIVCAARLCVWKGHRFLIEALTILRARDVPFLCDFAGADETGGEIERSVKAAGLQDVISFLGYVPHQDLVRDLERGDYDISVLASTERDGEHEGIPVAFMEAMAVGIPVVGTRTGSIPELVDNECGIIVEQQDAGALAVALERLILDPNLRRRLGENGRQKVFAEFETVAATRRLAELILESAPWSRAVPETRGQKSLV